MTIDTAGRFLGIAGVAYISFLFLMNVRRHTIKKKVMSAHTAYTSPKCIGFIVCCYQILLCVILVKYWVINSVSMSDHEFFLEAKRQGVHLFVGLFVGLCVWYLKPLLGAYIAAPILALVAVLYFSPVIAHRLPVVDHLLFHFERRKDIDEFPFKGAIWFNVGILVPATLLPTHLACAIIVVLSVGDSASTLFGKFFGKHRIGHKSLEGSLAFIVFATAGALFLVDFWTAVFLGVVGAALEVVDVFDDNVVVPFGLAVFSWMGGLR